jgi:hypothetical protein
MNVIAEIIYHVLLLVFIADISIDIAYIRKALNDEM